MKLGYLHISKPQGGESGVTRYSRFIAAEAKQRPDLSVLEVEITLSKDWRSNQTQLRQAAKQLSEADVVHIQYTKYIWGGNWGQLFDIWTFISQCSSPIVVTLHDIYPDIYPDYSLSDAWGREYEIQGKYQVSWFKRLARTVRSISNNYLADRSTLKWLSQQVQAIFVCAEEELQRLKSLINTEKVVIIPHFVEQRSVTLSPAAAGQKLGLEGFKIVTVQGFISGYKGHHLMIDALPKLPEDVKVIFAGTVAPNNEEYFEHLLKKVKDKGMSDRFQVTGFLSDRDLELYLQASHLAVCPFKVCSASGSLSTWISVARPILASNLPQIAEYNRIEPGAIHIFEPYNATALAEAIKQLLPNSPETEDAGVARLRDKLSIPIIFERHFEYYQKVMIDDSAAMNCADSPADN